MNIETERLVLRPFRAADFDDVHAYASDPEVTRYTSFGPNTPAETREFLARCKAETDDELRCSYSFAMTMLGADRVVGGIGFTIDRPIRRAAELGYVLHRDFWGGGIA